MHHMTEGKEEARKRFFKKRLIQPIHEDRTHMTKHLGKQHQRLLGALIICALSKPSNHSTSVKVPAALSCYIFLLKLYSLVDSTCYDYHILIMPPSSML